MNESVDDDPSKGKLDGAELARLTKDVVVAYTSNNAVAIGDLPGVIAMVGERFQALGQHSAEAAPARPEPVVPVRRSISPDEITCLLCGKRQKILKRHLEVTHSLTPDAYRELFGLKSDYPMIAPSYAQKRSELAKKIGLGQRQPPHRQRRRKASEES